MTLETQSSTSEVNLDVLLNVPVALSVEVGRAAMTIGELLETAEGSVVQLSRLIDEPLDILVNDAPIAQGVVVTQDGKFGIQITDIISPHERARNLQKEEQQASDIPHEEQQASETVQEEQQASEPAQEEQQASESQQEQAQDSDPAEDTEAT